MDRSIGNFLIFIICMVDCLICAMRNEKEHLQRDGDCIWEKKEQELQCDQPQERREISDVKDKEGCETAVKEQGYFFTALMFTGGDATRCVALQCVPEPDVPEPDENHQSTSNGQDLWICTSTATEEYHEQQKQNAVTLLSSELKDMPGAQALQQEISQAAQMSDGQKQRLQDMKIKKQNEQHSMEQTPGNKNESSSQHQAKNSKITPPSGDQSKQKKPLGDSLDTSKSKNKDKAPLGKDSASKMQAIAFLPFVFFCLSAL